jgi:hypothetical protein
MKTMTSPATPCFAKFAAGLILAASLLTTGCSVNKMIGWGAGHMMDGGIAAMYRETDLALARDAMPTQILLLEGLVESSPGDTKLRLYAAQSYYSYAFAFIEDNDPARAGSFYERAVGHARVALAQAGLKGDLLAMPGDELSSKLSRLGEGAVPAMFWTASALGKWVDVSRSDPAVLAHGFRAVMLMDRVLELDENYFFSGPNLFFGAFLAATPAALGGDMKRSRQYFEKARAANQGRLLIVDVLEAELLLRQLQDRKTFHDQLTAVVQSPPDLWPEVGLFNQVARAKAVKLLSMEDEWF